MSVTVTKAEGVTMLTMTSDPNSACPPLCQILKGLCYNPVCFSVSERLRRVQRSSQSLLGALQIMIGLLNIGLGAILLCHHRWSDVAAETVFPLWMGAIFMLCGSMNILSEKRPSPCLVLLNVILNLAGVAFAITAIVLYSLNIGDVWLSRCEPYWHYYDRTPPTPSPEETYQQEKCMWQRALILMLLRGINVLLIVLSVVELCIVISSVVLGIKTLMSREMKENQSSDDPEHYKPLLEEVSSNSAA